MTKSDTTEKTVGGILRAARLARRLSLEQMSEALHISQDYLDAIERDDIGILPGRIYALGFVRSYAKHCGLDFEALVEQFRAFYDATGPGDVGASLPANRAKKSAPLVDGMFDPLAPQEGLDLSKLPQPKRAARAAVGPKRAKPATQFKAPAAGASRRSVQARGTQASGWVSVLLMGAFAATGLFLLGGLAMRYSGHVVQWAGTAGAQLRGYAESYRTQLASGASTPVGNPRPEPVRRAGAQAPAVPAPATNDADDTRLTVEMRRIIEGRQNQLLLRPEPVMITRVLQNYKAQEIPDFIQDARIEIRASAPNWLQVEDENGRLIYAREMGAGTSFRLRCCAHYVISTRDGGTLLYFINDEKIGPVGEAGTPLTGKIIYSLKLARAALAR